MTQSEPALPSAIPSILLNKNSYNDDLYQGSVKPYNRNTSHETHKYSRGNESSKPTLHVQFDEENLKQKPSRSYRLNQIIKKKVERELAEKELIERKLIERKLIERKLIERKQKQKLLNTTLKKATKSDKIEQKKIKNFENVATMQVAIAEGNYNRTLKYKVKLATAEENNIKIIGFAHYPTSLSAYKKYAGYWKKISASTNYMLNKQTSRNIAIANNCKLFNHDAFLARHICMIIPNNININSFISTQGNNNWLYKSNPKQPLKQLPLRWCDQKANFFQPLVIRYNLCESGRHINLQGLCPYCPTSSNDSENGYADLFLKINDKSYEAHLARNHGVYASGNEMIQPYFAVYDEKKYYICAECKRVNKVRFSTNLMSHESLLEYFRHCTNRHFKKESAFVADFQLERIVEEDLVYKINGDISEDEDSDF
jgi:hypothetical protein